MTEVGGTSVSAYCEIDWQQVPKWSQCLVAKSVRSCICLSSVTLGRQWALSPCSVFLSQLWVMSPHVTWSVRSSAERSLRTAAARRSSSWVSILPYLSILGVFSHSPHHPKWWFGFVWVDVNPIKPGKNYFPLKTFEFFCMLLLMVMKVKVETLQGQWKKSCTTTLAGLQVSILQLQCLS